jgi:hypothetical protein
LLTIFCAKLDVVVDYSVHNKGQLTKLYPIFFLKLVLFNQNSISLYWAYPHVAFASFRWCAPSKFDPTQSPMLFFEKGMPIIPPLLPPEGLDLALKHMVCL